jgi:transposase
LSNLSIRREIVCIILCILRPEMGRVNTPILSLEQLQELQHHFRTSDNHSFRQRCQVVLLKSEGRNSKDVGAITGMCVVSVNTWLTRYKAEGVEGLRTKPGRGRKPILDAEEDKASILSAIERNRQRVSMAKAEWESASGRKVGLTTFKAFLKTLAEDISV